MKIFSLRCAAFLTLSLVLFGCGSAGPTGHSKVDQSKSTTALNLAEKKEMCHAWVDYLFSIVDTPEKWCQWKAQNRTTEPGGGITDGEVQASCAAAEAACLTDKDQQYRLVQESARAGCNGADPLGSTLMHSYSTCDTTVELVESCGAEQVDILDDLRSVSCSQFTVSRRTQINSELNAPSCKQTGCL